MVVLLATAGYDHAIRFWDASSGMCYKSFQHPDKQVNCLQISPDKQYCIAGGNPHIKLYDINAKGTEALVTYEGHTSNVTAVGFQRDGRWMYSCSEDGSVRIWDPRASTSQRDYDSRAGVNTVALHPNQGELISGDHSGTLRVWDLAANKCMTELQPEGDTPISSIAVANDASCVVASNYNGSCYVWSPKSSDDYIPHKKFNAHRAYILATRLSPDVRYLATSSSDRSVRIWNTSDWSLAHVLNGHSRWVWDATFSADSSYLVTASSDMTAKLWEVASGEVVRTYTGHHKAVTAVALNDAAPVGGSASSSSSAAAAPASGTAPTAGGSGANSSFNAPGTGGTNG